MKIILFPYIEYHSYGIVIDIFDYNNCLPQLNAILTQMTINIFKLLGISHISAASSQASYPPANGDDPTAYNNDNKDFMGYETNPAATFAYTQDDMSGADNDVNDMSNIDMSR